MNFLLLFLSSFFCIVYIQAQARIVIVPHRVHEQAQSLMTATYAMLQEQSFDKIILMCSCTSENFYGIALPCEFDFSLLSQVSCIQKDTVDKLSQHPLFYYYQSPFYNNVGMQLQYDFLYDYCADIAIVPLVVGNLSETDALQAALLLADCCTERTLIILSADIACHKNCMHDCPFEQSELCKIYERDAHKIQAIQSGSLQQQVALFDRGPHASLFAMLFALLQLPDFKYLLSHFVGYATSYDDRMHHKQRNRCDGVVTYAAFMFESNQCCYKNKIGSYEQLQLLQCARVSLCDLFQASVYRLPTMISYEMLQPHGVFASLYVMSDHGVTLQGCMGKLASSISLYEMVYQMTQQAACHDVRFYPLRQKDVDSTMISLSVITDYTRVRQCHEIQQSDGIVLQYYDKQTIALPAKVLTSDWDYQLKLMQLSHQMGLHSFIWKKPWAKIFTFHSMVFQED